MQDSSSGTPKYAQGKIAIPKLDRRPSVPHEGGEKKREDRVTRACQTCRKRKVRCSGEVPRCTNCRTNNLDCVYEQARRDRLKDAQRLNDTFVSLLKDLSARVDVNDKKRITEALKAAEDDLISPLPDSLLKTSGKRPRTRYIGTGDERTSGQHGETFATASVGSNEDLDFVSEDLLRNRESRETGYLGQNSEIQWLRSVQRQTERVKKEPYGVAQGPPGSSREAADERSSALHERTEDPRQTLRKGTMMNVTDANFYLDSDNIDVDIAVDPYEMPDPIIAERLFDCFMTTVHTSYPIVPAAFTDQFQRYIHSIRQNRPFQIPEKWRATMNMIFAIGAKYSHLIGAQWKGDDRDHLIYMTRAVQLLGLKDTVMIISGPDLQLVQATGLLAFYFLVIGHISRAWVVIGISIRLALALGLHLRNENPSTESSKKDSLTKMWWSLQAIECLVSSITGRPPILANEDCTVSIPIVSSGEQNTEGSSSGTAPRLKTESSLPLLSTSENTDSREPGENHYFNAHINMNILTQKALLHLYAPRTAVRSWEYFQSKITELLSELEAWSKSALPMDTTFNPAYPSQNIEREQFLLRIQYWSTKIIITRPCLCRVDRRVIRQNDRSANFNSQIADICVDAARELARLFPDEPDLRFIYGSGPWWTLVHIIMQSMAVFLLEMPYSAQHMKHKKAEQSTCITKLILWLYAMAHYDPVSGRAYQVVCRILKTCAPSLQAQANEILEQASQASTRTHPSQYFQEPMEPPRSGLWKFPKPERPQITTPTTFEPHLYNQKPTDPYPEYQRILHPYYSLDQIQAAMSLGDPSAMYPAQGTPFVDMNELWPRPGTSDDSSMDFFSLYGQHQTYLQPEAQQQIPQDMLTMEPIEEVAQMDYSPSQQHQARHY